VLWSTKTFKTINKMVRLAGTLLEVVSPACALEFSSQRTNLSAVSIVCVQFRQLSDTHATTLHVREVPFLLAAWFGDGALRVVRRAYRPKTSVDMSLRRSRVEDEADRIISALRSLRAGGAPPGVSGSGEAYASGLFLMSSVSARREGCVGASCVFHAVPQRRVSQLFRHSAANVNALNL
jgi:hypothetical protein